MKIKTLAIIAAAVCLLAACPAPPAGAVELRDGLGRLVKAPDHPRRIVALTPSLVEILYALGLGDRIVGATTWADHPPRAKGLPRVGAYVAPNLERIVALSPDLVLANREGNPPWAVDKLAASGIPVFVTWPNDPAKLPDGIRTLGLLCGAPEKGRDLAKAMRTMFVRVDKLLEGVKPVPVLMVIGSRPLVSVSPGSFNGKLLAMAKGSNIVPPGTGKWPRLSMEYVVKAAPRVVVVSTMERGQNLNRELTLWRNMPGLARTPGYRVVHLSSDLIDRPGPRLVKGLWQLARLLHPGRFADKDARP